MKYLTILLLTSLILFGCSSEYDDCVKIETMKHFISDEVAEARAVNICYREPQNFQNQEDAINAYIEEDMCIDENIYKIQQSNKRAELKAHDLCTMRIFDKDFGK